MRVTKKSKFELPEEINTQISELISINGLSLKVRELKQFYANFKAAYEKGDSYETSFQQALDNLRTVWKLQKEFETNDVY